MSDEEKSNETPKTPQERLTEAEAHVDAMAAEVEEFEEALEEAQDQLADAEEKRDAIDEEVNGPRRRAEAAAIEALAAERTGPIRPIGDRVVRTACDPSELPGWFSDSEKLKALEHDGRLWLTNGYMTIAATETGEAPMMPPGSGSAFGTTWIVADRTDLPVLEDNMWVREFGEQGADLRYVSLVEDLFPGLEWRSGGCEFDPIHAYVDGALVAAVMPVRRFRGSNL